MFDYDRIWEGSWNDNTRYGPACRHRRRIVGDLIRRVPHNRILDLGCGDGSLIAELSRHIKAEFTGADISGPAIEIARRNVPQATFQQLDLSATSLPGRYDVVVLSEVLEHIEDDEAVLRQVAAVAPHVVISVPGGPADKVDRRYGHFRNYAGDLLPRKLDTAGFDLVYYRRWGFPFHELSQAILERSTDPTTVVGGRYTPAKKIVAQMLYLLFFLNVLPVGSQVFAIGRSRQAG
ncbi:MAG TPA: class I SAM-dependent methyltransferase [Kiritimatiellia bacterium]|nr:class I SAM-dependent methyltransferase [Kiritimatiellia bacterium]